MSTQLRTVLAMGLAGIAALVAGPAAAAAADTPSSILVKVKPGTNVEALAERNGMSVKRYLKPIGWVELTARAGDGATASAAPAALGDRVEADPAVRSVDTADFGERVEWHFVPRDTVFNGEIKYGDGTQVGWHFIKPNFPVAWDQTQGAGVTVAVIDSEFDTANPDLAEKLTVRYNAASGTPEYRTGNVNPGPTSVPHGSHTSGLIGAKTDNGKGVAGACFECGIMAIKIGSEKVGGTFVDASFLGDVAEGLIFAANSGARVINMSLGGPRPHQPLLDAVNYAYGKGAVIVASAGNSQQSNPGVANYPAAYPNVIGVGATNSKDEIAPFSSQGSWVDIAAPGETILSTTSSNDPEALTFLADAAPKPLLAVKSGTSMAAPLVAGLAGLMLAVRPDLNAAEVETLLRASARDLGIAGHDPLYGAGRLEAGAAVAAAQAYVRPVPPASPPPAPPKRKRAKRVGSKVFLSVSKSGGKLRLNGQLMTRPRCKKKRKVVLLAKGSRRPIATTKTNPRGVFNIRLPKGKSPKGKIRIVVKPRKLRGVVCKGSASRLVNAG